MERKPMTGQHLAQTAESYLQRLCVEIPERRVGSDGNRQATGFVADVFASYGFAVERPAFACMDWTSEGAHLSTAGASFAAHPSPYSPGGQAHAPLVVVSTVDELEQAELSGRIALLRGEIAREPLMPKNFPWWNPDEHKRIIGLLEAKQPAAIISATGRNPQMAGAVYPFPMFEDGDFDIPLGIHDRGRGRAAGRARGRDGFARHPSDAASDDGLQCHRAARLRQYGPRGRHGAHRCEGRDARRTR
jgi:aminopeptidase YwaD